MPGFQPGSEHGGFLVESILGEGGTAAVYRVRQRSTGQSYAMKVLHTADRGHETRLVREAGVLAQLRHPNIVRTYGFLMIEERPALLMDVVEGPTLADVLASDRPSTNAGLALFRSVLRGVAHAHEAGFVHRDLKPANVLLTARAEGWHPRVTDFGIVRILSPEGFSAHQTRTGMAMGTLGYMAPEQIADARRADHRADIFSLGVILYELTCGRRPFTSAGLVELVAEIRVGVQLDPAGLAPDLPAWLRHAFMSCLAFDPAQRPATCGELAAMVGLDADFDGTPPPAPTEGQRAADTYVPDES